MTISAVDYELCTACGTCIDVCPMDVFRDRGDGSPAILYADDCQCCYLCELKCPADALQVLPHRAFMPEIIWGQDAVS